jgi:hypothetical protein
MWCTQNEYEISVIIPTLNENGIVKEKCDYTESKRGKGRNLGHDGIFAAKGMTKEKQPEIRVIKCMKTKGRFLNQKE